jgi:hypothetical protein
LESTSLISWSPSVESPDVSMSLVKRTRYWLMYQPPFGDRT